MHFVVFGKREFLWMCANILELLFISLNTFTIINYDTARHFCFYLVLFSSYFPSLSITIYLVTDEKNHKKVEISQSSIRYSKL